MSTERARRLGRGLEALIAIRPDLNSPQAQRNSEKLGLRQIPVADVHPNPRQPRKAFDEAQMAELEASIRENGLLQPIVVRPSASGFELIAGERRLRAAQHLGWREIPAIVRETDDQAALTLALIENLQRTDLNPIEEAEGYQQLMSQFSLTQLEVAEVVGKERSTVANTLRLLQLPAQVRRLVRDGALSIGHARAMLALGDEYRIVQLAKTTIAEGLNVREVEQRVRETGTPRASRRPQTGAAARRAPEVGEIEAQLRRQFQTDVRLRANARHKGEVAFAFYSADDLERLLDLLLGAGRERS